jgi:hypothetical protein
MIVTKRKTERGANNPDAFFEPVVYKNGQLFQHEREYFYILGEIPAER